MLEQEISIALDALQTGNLGPLQAELESNSRSSTLGLLANTEIFGALSHAMENENIGSWITKESTWNAALFSPGVSLTTEEKFLHLLWQVFSLRLAKSIESLKARVTISQKGSIICFPGSFNLSILVSYSAPLGPGIPFLRPLAAVLNPTGMLDLERFLQDSSPKERNAIKSSIMSVDKLVYHRGVVIHVDRQRENVFGPTVDTVVLTELLNSRLNELRGTNYSVLEIGPGSGLITVSAAVHPNVTRTTCVEINGQAATCTLKNLALNGRSPSSNNVSVSVRAEKFLPLSIGESHDILVCNPPYVPEVSGVEHLGASGYGRAISGLELYDDILDNLPTLLTKGGSALLMLSSVSFEYILPKIPKNYDVRYPIGNDGYKVPLDLDMLWEREEWRKDLARKGLIEVQSDDQIFHRIIPIWVESRTQ